MPPQRGEFGTNWWSRRWIEALEGFGWQERLKRGRSYARNGRVIDVEVGTGAARARVQGSRPRPYRVTIRVEPFSDDVWARVASVLGGQAIYSARLLAGEIPNEVEVVCEKVGASLLPRDARDLHTECSCPDWVNPCKHVAAVHYALASEFDRDPFLLFRLRGRSRDELNAELRAQRGSGLPATVEQEPVAPPEPLEPILDRFWDAGPELATIQVEVRPPEVPAGILKRLGRPPVWGGSEQFQASLELLYRAASARVRDRALDAGETTDPTATE